MKTTAVFLVTAATLSHPVIAGGGGDNTWSTWTTAKAPEKTPVPEVGWTDWVTTTEYKEKTVTTTEYNTITVTETPPPVTVTLPPVTETETETLPPVTETLPPITETLPPVTETETETETLPPVTVTETQTVVSVSGSVATVQNTVVNTVENTVVNTVVNTVENTAYITSISVATETVSVCPTTSVVLTGLVPCPSRITNTDYSPPTPLPDNYLWGCAPGTLCHPKKVNCNFESNPPAEGYVCAPEECLPVVPYPITDTTGLEDVNSTCAWLTPVDDYYNINPTLFGLTFDIFKAFGQEECSYTPPPPPPSTTTLPPPPPPPPTTTTTPLPPPPPPSSSSSWSVWVAPAPVSSSSWSVWVAPAPVSSSWSAWSAAPAPVSSQWSAWGQPSKVTPAPVSSGWNNWDSNGGGNHNYGGHVTKRAALMPRQADAAQQVIAGPACYAACNAACGIFQSVGKEDRLCEDDSDFQNAIANIDACNERHPADGTDLTTKVDALAQALRYCATRTQAAATSTAEAQQAETTPAAAPQSTPAAETPAPAASSQSSAETPAAPSASGATEGGASTPAAATTAAVTSLVATPTTAASPSLVSSIPSGQNAAGQVQAMSPVITFILSVLALFVRI